MTTKTEDELLAAVNKAGSEIVKLKPWYRRWQSYLLPLAGVTGFVLARCL